jgi:polyhydroxybutyrate depolymerase
MSRAAAALALALCAAACGGAPSGPCSLEPGTRRYAVSAAGATRRYRVTVGPAAAPAGRAPLVFLWHGYGASADSIAPALEPADYWPEAVVVAPEGLPRTIEGFSDRMLPGWQLRGGELGDRDLTFFDAMLADVEARYCIDPERVYSAGFSNGGFFTNLLGCARSGVLAAIAPVGGGGPDGAACGAPLPALVTHGTRDEVVPFANGAGSYRHWADAAHCADAPAPATTAPGCVDARGCAVDVEMCSFAGPHTWPAGASERIVAFFREHVRRRAGAAAGP